MSEELIGNSSIEADEPASESAAGIAARALCADPEAYRRQPAQPGKLWIGSRKPSAKRRSRTLRGGWK